MVEQPPRPRSEQSLEHISFEGFSPEQESFVRELISSITLPLGNVRKVFFTAYDPARAGEPRENKFVSFAGYQMASQTLFIYKEGFTYASRLSPVRKFAFMANNLVHELSHSVDPTMTLRFQDYIARNPAKAEQYPQLGDVWPNREALEKADTFVRAVARQSLLTGEYLNSYHTLCGKRFLKVLKQHSKNKISDAEYSRSVIEFESETWAILVQLRYIDPEKIRTTEKRQRRKWKGNESFTSLQTGIDTALDSLFAGEKQVASAISQTQERMKAMARRGGVWPF